MTLLLLKEVVLKEVVEVVLMSVQLPGLQTLDLVLEP